MRLFIKSVIQPERYRLFIAILALVAFVGQSVASPHACDTMTQHMSIDKAQHSLEPLPQQADTDTSAGMGHNMGHGMHMPMTDTLYISPADCCENQQCSLTDCLSLTSAAVDGRAQNSFEGGNIPSMAYTEAYATAETAELYHPPISR